MNRRNFAIHSSAAALAAASSGKIVGANGRLRVANIGCGRRRLLRELLQVKDTAQIEVAAVCDTWRQRLDAAEAEVKEMTGKSPVSTPHFKELLARKDIDAVVIGTPDHQHCEMLIAAVEAGKDVYVEKPLAMNMKELVRAYDAVKKSGRIVQLGTQMRSYRQARGLRTFLKAGKLGQVLKVEQVRNGYSPYWVSYGGPDALKQEPSAKDVDWNAFLLGRAPRPFDADQYASWYGYRDFSQGPHTNLMVHFIDLVHFVGDTGIPKRVVAMGGTYHWKGRYTVPDSVEVTLEYPEGFVVRYCTVFGNGAGNYARWQGTRGTIDARNLSPRERWIATPAGAGVPDKLTGDVAMEEPEIPHHMEDFFQSVRSRKPPIAPIEAGFAHSVAILMADESMQTGRRMTYDAKRREILPG